MLGEKEWIVHLPLRAVRVRVGGVSSSGPPSPEARSALFELATELAWLNPKVVAVAQEIHHALSGGIGQAPQKPVDTSVQFQRFMQDVQLSFDSAVARGSLQVSDASVPIPVAEPIATEPILGPSPIQEEPDAELTFIALELVDQDGNPVPNQPFTITLPDGSEQRGSLNDAGKAKINRIPPGQCKVIFDRFDERDFQ